MTVLNEESTTMNIKEKSRCCGNCALFSNEDTDGEGICEFHQEVTDCELSCEYHLQRSEADSLIKKTNELSVLEKD